MTGPVIERADELPLLIYWLLKMQVDLNIDRVLPPPHPNRQGLSYGQLAVLFVAYVIDLRNHRLSEMEEWVAQHQGVLWQITPWLLQVKDATDDRLGDLLSALGQDEQRGAQVQQELGQHLIRAYRLPSEVARYDTTTFSVQHAPDVRGQSADGLLAFGHSKDHRPDLLQFKQGLGTLDPAGIPLYTDTRAGHAADDPLYVPAWRRLKATLGHSHFLFVADCKAGALASRAQIDAGQGRYLFPLPMTGKIPETLRAWVLHPPVSPEPMLLVDPRKPDEPPMGVGSGFVIDLGLYAILEDGLTRHAWMERWLVTRSDSLAKHRQAVVEKHLQTAETELQTLNRKGFPSAAELETAAQKVLERQQVTDLLQITVGETVTEHTRYIGRGRPGPQHPTQVPQVCQASLTCRRNQAAIEQANQLAGWRIHVTNVSAEAMNLSQAIRYYRDEFLVEHGMHRFKHGSLPALPLFLQIPERIRGLMLLLMIALQVLTLLEFVAQRELTQRGETICGLVPGNPKMQTAHPSAERLLARFSGLNWLREPTETGARGRIVEELTPVQKRILDILGVPGAIFVLSMDVPVHYYRNLT